MKIGIIGSNPRAVAIGRLLASGGHDLSFSDPQSGEAAERAAAEIGAFAESAYDQTITRELLLFACARRDVDRTLAAMGPASTAPSSMHSTAVLTSPIAAPNCSRTSSTRTVSCVP